jgi:hypothetical protein
MKDESHPNFAYWDEAFDACSQQAWDNAMDRMPYCPEPPVGRLELVKQNPLEFAAAVGGGMFLGLVIGMLTG